MVTESQMNGKAAEYRVASELILRGIVPCFPALDTGVDLVTTDGVRIQIKSCRTTYSSGAAHFSLCSRKKDGKLGWRKFSEECDFFILWHITTDRFWIAPSALFDGFSTCCVGTVTRKAKWTSETRIEALRLRNEGLSQAEIAAKIGQGMTRENVKHMLKSENYGKRLGGRCKEGSPITLSEQVEVYEDCWDLLKPESFEGELIPSHIDVKKEVPYSE